MVLEVGRAGKVRLIRGIKKTNIFECGDNGMVVERENNIITLYATNSRCSEIYATVTLGTNNQLKKHKFVGIAYSQDKMLLDGGDIMVVVDYNTKKVAVNQREIQVAGSKHWGESVRMAWNPRFNAMFGLDVDQLSIGLEAATNFWNWFEENEEIIAEKIAAGGEEAREMIGQISRELCPVFPYKEEADIEFQLGCSDGMNEFYMYHFNEEMMKTDAEALGQMMPESLKAAWKYITEA